MKLNKLQLLALLALCWGPSFLFIKIAVVEIPPLMLAALRIGTGALILNAVLLIRRDFLPRNLKFWKDIFVAGFFSVALPFILINWGQQFVDSSLGSLLNGLTPICTVVFAQILLKEKLEQNSLGGILLAFLGLGVLVYPSLKDGLTGSTFGIIAISAAAASYGIGWVLVKKNLTKIASFKAPAAELLAVSVYLVPLAIIAEPSFSLSEVSLTSYGAVLGLGSFGTAIAFILYFKLLDQAGPSFASMVTYLVPIIGVFLGVFILHEVLTIWTIAGAAFILSGIYIGSKKPRKKNTPVCQIDCV